jgi:amidohydrolase
MDIRKLALEVEQYVVEHRRYLHRHPELSGQEDATVAYIMAALKNLGVPATEVPQGGVVAVVEGREPGKTVLLRADVDALPIDESPVNLLAAKSCVSEHPGVAHMCGHDAHTAMLLGAVKILSENRDAFNGRVIAAFERGEEGGRGEVKNLIRFIKENGLGYDFCWGIHVNDRTPSGTLLISDGPVHAGYYMFDYAIRGRGGHGSRPDLFVSPIDCFVAIYNGYNSLRWRAVSPFEQLTSSIGLLNTSSGKNNIIPDEVRFSGSVRFYSEEKAARPFIEALDALIQDTARAYHCEARGLETLGPNPSVNNDPQWAATMRNVIADVLGCASVGKGEASMGSESYAYFMKESPGLFASLGEHNPEKGTGGGMHNALFDMDEDALKYGVMASLSVALQVLRDS